MVPLSAPRQAVSILEAVWEKALLQLVLLFSLVMRTTPSILVAVVLEFPVSVHLILVIFTGDADEHLILVIFTGDADDTLDTGGGCAGVSSVGTFDTGHSVGEGVTAPVGVIVGVGSDLLLLTRTRACLRSSNNTSFNNVRGWFHPRLPHTSFCDCKINISETLQNKHVRDTYQTLCRSGEKTCYN
jgi:hypothetical protein